MPGPEPIAQLAHEAGAAAPTGLASIRNEVATKRMEGSTGDVPLAVSCHRDDSLEPELVTKGQTRINGIGDKRESARRHRSNPMSDRFQSRIPPVSTFAEFHAPEGLHGRGG